MVSVPPQKFLGRRDPRPTFSLLVGARDGVHVQLRICLLPLRHDKRSSVLVAADGTWRSDWPERV